MKRMNIILAWLLLGLFQACNSDYQPDGMDDLRVIPCELSFENAAGTDLLAGVPVKNQLLADPHYAVGYMIGDVPVTFSGVSPVQAETGIKITIENEKYYLSLLSAAFTQYLRRYMQGVNEPVQICVKFKCPLLFGDENVHRLEGTWMNDGQRITPADDMTIDGKSMTSVQTDYAVRLVCKLPLADSF